MIPNNKENELDPNAQLEKPGSQPGLVQRRGISRSGRLCLAQHRGHQPHAGHPAIERSSEKADIAIFHKRK